MSLINPYLNRSFINIYDEEMNENDIDEYIQLNSTCEIDEKKSWYDKVMVILFSKGFIILNNILIISILFYYYIILTIPNIDNILYKYNNTDLYNDLYLYQYTTINERISIIILISIPYMIYMILLYTKIITNFLRGYELNICKGVISTFLGLCCFIYFIIHTYCCFTNINYKSVLLRCSNSYNKQLKLMNNILIQMFLICILTLFLYIVQGVLQINELSDIKKNINLTWSSLTSIDTYNSLWKKTIYIFDIND